jgi:hypothetical protein
LGKPYSSEIAQLDATYAWALQAPIDGLAEAIADSACFPLLATGSGGSLTAAHFASFVHQRFSDRMGKAVTPLEMVSTAPHAKELVAMFLSAGGSNADITAAFEQMAGREPHRLIVLSLSIGSALSHLAKQYWYVDLFEYEPPSGKDGFLATNSLLTFSVLLYRAWHRAFGAKEALPDSLGALVHPGMSREDFAGGLTVQCDQLWGEATISVLHGPSAYAAALDLESKFTEAALGVVQVADYRNFAHGRHHWFAKRPHSGILALITDDDRDLADRTLRLIPANIPVARVEIPAGGAEATLASLVFVLQIVGLAGRARGTDPGRPGVPQFGRRIYNLRGFRSKTLSEHALSSGESIAIERKARVRINVLADRGELEVWRGAYGAFVKGIRTVQFDAVVFDYDGTLCDRRDRFSGVGGEVIQHVNRLLEGGVFVAVATGRGKSPREDFRRKLPHELWSRVLLSYYNGADIGLLIDNTLPDGANRCCNDLSVIYSALRSDTRVAKWSECECRRMQVTVVPKPFAPLHALWEAVRQIVFESRVSGASVVRSSHSIDVIAPGVSKRGIVREIDRFLGNGSSARVLCIGDRGEWPGNDYDLLAEPFALSVDEVSSDPNTCWNLAPAGHRSVQASLDYLGWMNAANGKVSMTPEQTGCKPK